MNNIELNIKIPFSGGTISVVLYKDFCSNSLSKIARNHTHSKYELHYISEGVCVYKFKDREFSCREKETVLIPPNCHHSVHAKDKTVRTYTFLFSIEGVKKGDVVLNRLMVEEPTHLRRSTFMATRIFEICESLQKDDEIYNDMIRGSLILTFANIGAMLGIDEPKRVVDADDENRGEKIEEYISNNYHKKDCSCKGLAEYLNISKRQAYRLCVYYHKTSFVNLLRNIRMETAKFLLEKGGKTITEIADEVGYSSVASFSSSYKRYFGRSPSEDLNR